MSFILDALKKSESDRQRQSGPSLFEVKVTPPRRTLPVWAMAIAVLLGINIIVVCWMLLRHPATQQPPPVSNARAAAAPPSTVSTASSERGGTAGSTAKTAPAPTPAAPASSAARVASSSQPPAAAAAPARGGSSGQSAGQSGGQTASGSDQSDSAPTVEPGAAQGAGASGGTADDLPLYQQIVSSAGLPALHLDLHVFAEHPRDRFVMINMHRLGEGDSLPSGVHVDAIRTDGVVLSYRGTRFLLPRN